MLVNIDVDDISYDEIAKSFVLNFMRVMIDRLAQHGCITIDHNCSVNPNDDDKIFKIGFALLTEFENEGGFIHNDHKYFITCLFNDNALESISSTNFIGSDLRTSLHGNVEDSIPQAILKACAARTQ